MDSGQVEVGRLEQHQKILLHIIGSFSNALENPTSALLHEYILLCQLKSEKRLPGLLGYDFHAYMRGPYSEELRNDLEILYRLKLIEVIKGGLVVTEHGKDIIKKNRKGKGYNTATDTCQKVLNDFSTAPAISQGIFDSLKKVPLGDVIR